VSHESLTTFSTTFLKVHNVLLFWLNAAKAYGVSNADQIKPFNEF
jgi:hypothetical protein